ncbi:MAG: flippase-like domain-containing protein [Ignavibacteriaceae bacterium]|nr:flippase-like domain-containing protein [Ignavibacteriaceae bacterium]
MFAKIKRNIFISLAAAGLLYLLFSLYADFDKVLKAFSLFNWFLLPLLLLLSFSNYVTRFLKWDFYLRLLNIKINKIDSFSVFMSGLIMSVTPGKMGELLKAYLVKQISGEPISKTAPIIFAERITDFLSLIFIGLIGGYVYNFGRGIIIAVGIFFVIVTIALTNKNIGEAIINFFSKINFVKKYGSHVKAAYESSYQMLQIKPLFQMSLLSLAAWFLECLGYYIILVNFKVEVSLLWASFSYAFATIVGAISMLPGGLGVTEGSLTVLLQQEHYSLEIAFASTFIIRIVTLWFAVLVGVISVLLYQKRFGKITIEQ